MKVFVFDLAAESSAEFERFAGAIGARFDQGENIIYRGTNSSMGFHLSLSEGVLTVELTGFQDSPPALSLNAGSGLNYENTGASIVFGGRNSNDSNDSSVVQCAIVPYNSATGGGYAYILRDWS